jgi:hypothetical protein
MAPLPARGRIGAGRARPVRAAALVLTVGLAAVIAEPDAALGQAGAVATPGTTQAARAVMASEEQEARRVALAALFKAAVDDPNGQGFADWLKTLPEHDGRYIVEGDLLLSEDELRADLQSRRMQLKKAKQAGKAEGGEMPGPELVVDKHAGKLNYWELQSQRTLRYSVDKSSFGSGMDGKRRYDAVVGNIAKAARAWEGLCPSCGVSFVHVKTQDASPNFGQVNFVVRLGTSIGAAALAPFPHETGSARTLRLDDSYFAAGYPYHPIGVFRHELGHVLGYRHEHVNVPDKPPPPYQSCLSLRPGERNQGPAWADWEPVTPYDPLSAMHYPCPGVGNGTFALSARDQAGHEKLYLHGGQ